MYVCVYLGRISTLIHIWLNNIDILSIHFCIDPFKLLYRRELVDKPSIINYFSSTFDQMLGHHLNVVVWAFATIHGIRFENER